MVCQHTQEIAIRKTKTFRKLSACGSLLAVLFAAACSSDSTPGDGGNNDGSTSQMDAGQGDGSNSGNDGSSMADGVMSLPDGTVIGPDGQVMVSDAAPADSGGGADAGPCVPRACAGGGGVAQCADCIDNDRDGLADDRDPECLGPCDNTEGPILLTGVPERAAAVAGSIATSTRAMHRAAMVAAGIIAAIRCRSRRTILRRDRCARLIATRSAE